MLKKTGGRLQKAFLYSTIQTNSKIGLCQVLQVRTLYQATQKRIPLNEAPPRILGCAVKKAQTEKNEK
jgi:hypothetical protein